MKRLRTSVDVLAMSATPIPRTLEMAITGSGDVHDRDAARGTTPGLTYVGAYDDSRSPRHPAELLRDGQVFFIHNRVQSIEKAAARLRELVPERRVATAHGQMGEHQLEQVMLDFWEKQFDVLVCTTIVESAWTSPTPTRCIERADTLGLSQLHQLRGRVGRSRERRLRVLPLPGREAADRDRARALGHPGPALRPRRRHGHRDEGPEIRGAGNLLGVSSPVTSPTWASTSTSGWSASRPGVRETTTRKAEQPVEIKIELRRRAPPPTTSAASGSAGDVQAARGGAPTRTWRRCARRCSTGTAPTATGHRLLLVASFRARCRAAALSRSPFRQVRAVPPRRAAGVPGRAAESPSPEEPLQGPGAYDAGAAPPAPASVRSRLATRTARMAREVIDGVVDPIPVAAGRRPGGH